MKRMFKILVVMLAIVSATSAEAQTKEFLTQFNEVKRLVELPNSSAYKSIEIAQYPSEILRAMGTNVSVNGRNILNNIKVIYQVKIPLDSSYGRAAYNLNCNGRVPFTCSCAHARRCRTLTQE